MSEAPGAALRGPGAVPVRRAGAGLHHHHGAGRELGRAAVCRARVRHGAEREIVGQRAAVRRAIHQRIAAQCLQFAREDDALVRQRVDERLLADGIAREQQPPRAPVPQREGVHAVEPAHEVRPLALVPLPVQRQDDLAVALAAEAVPRRRQFGAQRAVVPDLRVGDEQARAIRARHRLVPARREVHDGQPPVPERERPVLREAAVVGPAVRERRRQRRDARRISRPRRIEPEFPGDAAHVGAQTSDQRAARPLPGTFP